MAALEYESKPPPPGKRRRYLPTTREGWTWWRRRVAVYMGLVSWFAAVAAYFGPNVILFRKLTWIEPDDFRGRAMRELPVILAIKEFADDNGRLPKTTRELEPKYLPPRPNTELRLENGRIEFWSEYNHRLIYDFTPGDDHWEVRGQFTNGRLSLGPATRSMLGGKE